ncbi:MAG: hypothetical protein K5639_02445 [Eubacterium sp.]|nr:hypothetical protein [Eubacterium sp.]
MMKKLVSLLCCLAVFAQVMLTGCVGEPNAYGKYSESWKIGHSAKTEGEPGETEDPDITPTPTPTEDPNALTPAEQKKADKFKKTKVKGLKIKKSIEKKVKLSWKKQSGATSYNVLRSKKKKSGYKTVATIKKTSYTDKNAAKRKQYYYKVQAQLKIKKKTFSGKASAAKSVYVVPKVPCSVIAGECFVYGMLNVKGHLPKNVHLLGKIGINSYTMLHSNYFSYKGQNITGIERIAYYHPDRVYFLVGSNESAWATTGYTMGNFTKMYNLLRKINKHIEFILVKIPPMGAHRPGDAPTDAERAKFNSAYQSFAKKHSCAFFCPSTDVLASGNRLKSAYDDGDGLHWNDSGSIAVINNMKKWSKKKFGTW